MVHPIEAPTQHVSTNVCASVFVLGDGCQAARAARWFLLIISIAYHAAGGWTLSAQSYHTVVQIVRVCGMAEQSRSAEVLSDNRREQGRSGKGTLGENTQGYR